ncbi:MAG: hypothetical protein ACMUIG_09870 [Thermoplasmatota archaeon]
MSESITDGDLFGFISGNREVLSDLIDIRTSLTDIEYEIVGRLAVLEEYHYDEARFMVRHLFMETIDKMDLQMVRTHLKTVLIPEQREILRKFLIDECGIKPEKVRDTLREADTREKLAEAAENVDDGEGHVRSSDSSKRLARWDDGVDELAGRYFATVDIYRKLKYDVKASMFGNGFFKGVLERQNGEKLFDLVSWTSSKVLDFPYLKDLKKPTIVLVGGSSGTGKSTISQHITNTLGIPTYASTDVISREIVRKTMSWLMGGENAGKRFPELFGSSFSRPDLDWFYGHSILTMIGVKGVLDRLIFEGRSGVIEGVPLIPGLLPAEYFDRANIVWIVTCIGKENIHYARYSGRDLAGVDRGGSGRYLKKFRDIRRTHDRMVEMGDLARSMIIDNSGHLRDSLDKAIMRVESPFAETGAPVTDEIRERVFRDIESRRGKIDLSSREPVSIRKNTGCPVGTEITGPNPDLVRSALELWILRNEEEIGRINGRIEKGNGDPEKLRDEIHHRLDDIRLAGSILDPDTVSGILRSKFELLKATRSLLIQLRSTHLQLLSRLATLPAARYDDAKRDVYMVLKSAPDEIDIDTAKFSIKELMLPELKNRLREFYLNEYSVGAAASNEVLNDLHMFSGLRENLEHHFRNLSGHPGDLQTEMMRVRNIIDIWEKGIDDLTEKHYEIYRLWRTLEDTEIDIVCSDPAVAGLIEEQDRERLHRLIRWLTPRIYDVPRVKNLEKRPTIILVSGSSKTGKDSVSQYISKTLSIPIYFSTSIVREVVRSTFDWVLGRDRAEEIFPELFGSVYDGGGNEIQVALSMIGVMGAMDRLIKENSSGVINGSVLVPGYLPERYYERANIIQMVLNISDERDHMVRIFGEEIGDPGSSRFESIRAVNDRMRALAEMNGSLVIETGGNLENALYNALNRVESPYADRGLPIPDERRHTAREEIEGRMEGVTGLGRNRFRGALLTDIDDTLIPSGVTPDDEWIGWLAGFLKVLGDNDIAWIPMSGVALVKLGPRILYRLPEEVMENVIPYLGDGSQKYVYNQGNGEWEEDLRFSRRFSDSQTAAVMGITEFRNFLMKNRNNGENGIISRLETAVSDLDRFNESMDPGVKRIDPDRGLIGELEDELEASGIRSDLEKRGYDIRDPETYFRGGSVSFMMLGDISAEPYEEEDAYEMRTEKLITHARRRLKELGNLSDLGGNGIHVPFPGARGIKFVLMGNDKERGARDLVDNEGILPESMIFLGNELFEGGNDNMMRRIPGMTLISVGKREDPGVVNWGSGVEDTRKLFDLISGRLKEGIDLQDIIEEISGRTGN